MRAKGVLDRKYIFEYEVGLFPFGTCRVLRDRASNDLRNCKVVPKSTLRSSNTSGIVLERLNQLKSLQGTHIAAVTDVLEDPSNIYIISEFCAGGDVGDWMERLTEDHLLEEQTCSTYVRQALLALSQGAARNLFHRHLQPHNLLLTTKLPDAIVKVNDIGLAGILDPDGSILQRHVQKNPYVAPEMRDGSESSWQTGSPDIWSMGAIAHQLLVGQAPSASSSGSGPMEWLSRLSDRHGRLDDLWADRSPTSRDLTEHLLQPPEQRPTAARALQHPWLKSTKAAAGGQPDQDPRQKTLCYALAVLLIPVLVPYRDFTQLQTAFKSQDSDSDGFNAISVVRRILLTRCSLDEAVSPAMTIMDVGGTGYLDMCGTACADLVAREFFAAGPTGQPLSGPFRAADLAPRMLKRFFEVYGEKKQSGGGAAGTASIENVRSRSQTATAIEMELHAGVVYDSILSTFPDDRVIDTQALAYILTENGGQGTPLESSDLMHGVGSRASAELEEGPLANFNLGFMDFFQTCGVGSKRDESPHSIGVSSRAERRADC